MSKQLRYQGDYFQVWHDQGWEYVTRTHANGIVAIIAVTAANELVLVEQYRPPVKRCVLELPAGLVGDEPEHPTETILDAARRELLEETGYQADHFTPLATYPVSPGMSDESLSFFHAHTLQKVAAGGGIGVENITVHLAPLANIDEYLAAYQQNDGLIDIKIYSGLYLLNVATRPRG
ncbi:MAG: NUDIX domain-containing protein [Legionellales bacterium]|nr:NUDIX domain-containing protein [Legionellales bacterium]